MKLYTPPPQYPHPSLKVGKITSLGSYNETLCPPSLSLKVGKIPYGEKFGDLFGYATLLEFVQYMDGYGLHSSLDIDAENFQAPLYIFDDKILENHFKAQYTFDGNGVVGVMCEIMNSVGWH